MGLLTDKNIDISECSLSLKDVRIDTELWLDGLSDFFVSRKVNNISRCQKKDNKFWREWIQIFQNDRFSLGRQRTAPNERMNAALRSLINSRRFADHIRGTLLYVDNRVDIYRSLKPQVKRELLGAWKESLYKYLSKVGNSSILLPYIEDNFQFRLRMSKVSMECYEKGGDWYSHWNTPDYKKDMRDEMPLFWIQVYPKGVIHNNQIPCMEAEVRVRVRGLRTNREIWWSK